ncbi:MULTISPECIES: PEF-CTERM sorting domain-containing protein [Methanococcoides]|jgi:PKD repeat protein|uniref:PEF-CTERM sorting domain-containing protein n=1 Tax=Methanococcoides seepicolus TaxID=2828780 RepID=A0A9E4ZEX6_9EURY|nr:MULTISPECIES: PEF-CTERM sorting domain-containing protein [Methanococcoides]MCM1986405.1 PEF-CTERM sorting domain-containing protein [Methanococcoides seepicolus]
MNPVIKPVGLLLLITLLLSGLTIITDAPPELPKNTGEDGHESNFSELYEQDSHESNFSELSNQTTSNDDVVPEIRVSNGDYVSPEPVSPLGPVTANILPMADFVSNVTVGVPPFSVMFTDLSQNATSISWDVNGDGVEDSRVSEFIYVYNTPGTYDVSLTATNSNGNDVKFDTVVANSPEEIPEFPTIALPVLIVLGLMFLLQRRK